MVEKKTATSIKAVLSDGGFAKLGVTPFGGFIAGVRMYCSMVSADNPLKAMWINAFTQQSKSGREKKVCGTPRATGVCEKFS